jgi:Leucine-rich repeat (LRR) protein
LLALAGAEVTRVSTAVATALHDVARRAKEIEAISLPEGSDDLTCCNIMCEFVGEPCACRLGVALSRVPHLKRLEIPNHRLRRLPDTLGQLRQLEYLDIQGCCTQLVGPLALISRPGNELSNLDVLSGLSSLKYLNICNNTLESTLPPQLLTRWRAGEVGGTFFLSLFSRCASCVRPDSAP